MARIYGMMAEFDGAADLLAAARKVRAAGYQDVEAYTPYPLEELDEILALESHTVRLLTLLAGVGGAVGGFFMCWYAFVLSYPLDIGGRPHNSWPAWIPLTFEVGVLCAGLTAGLGMLLLCGLPRLHHPVFNVPRFSRASQDRFFLVVEATDSRFDPGPTAALLRQTGARHVTEVPS